MKLSDIMSSMGLASYAEVALVIFFVVFLAVVAHVMNRRNTERFERARHLPLDDGKNAPLRTHTGDVP